MKREQLASIGLSIDATLAAFNPESGCLLLCWVGTARGRGVRVRESALSVGSASRTSLGKYLPSLALHMPCHIEEGGAACISGQGPVLRSTANMSPTPQATAHLLRLPCGAPQPVRRDVRCRGRRDAARGHRIGACGFPRILSEIAGCDLVPVLPRKSPDVCSILLFLLLLLVISAERLCSECRVTSCTRGRPLNIARRCQHFCVFCAAVRALVTCVFAGSMRAPADRLIFFMPR